MSGIQTYYLEIYNYKCTCCTIPQFIGTMYKVRIIIFTCICIFSGVGEINSARSILDATLQLMVDKKDEG